MTSATSLSRRNLLKAGAVASAAVLVPAVSASAASTHPQVSGTEHRFRALEQKYGARLGVYAHNIHTGRVVTYRPHERFAMCSTFKSVAAGALLRDHDCSAPLDKVIRYRRRDLVANSPITEQHVDDGMTVGELCAAAIRYSDNTAGNLLLRQIGGPEGLTRFFRSLGDPVSRLDRWETDLNTAIPGDLRDTTTPAAMGRSYETLTLGPALSTADRRQLVTWLQGNTTSAKRFRAGLPKDWIVADKTGTGDYASANDIGVTWTTERTPIVLTVLSSKPAKDAPVDDEMIADAARLLAHTLAPGE
ncbi:class A beta-lactamase [Streptomyces sp. NBC_00344]|uniref:class A beta-lactamase n=1 Tax=Streptomyces sp. NBC_00344 TaxID=2975720 RepID=UPI002E1DC6B9